MQWKSCSKPLMILAALLGLGAYGAAATVTVLYSFKDRTDGYSPAGVIMVDGKLYGTTATGGAYDSGTVFELVHTSSGWAKTALHEFTGGADGWNPTPGLVADKAGRIYGAAGQILKSGVGGIIFEISPDSDAESRFKVIYAFRGYGPSALTIDGAGTLYGVTAGGGGDGCFHGQGCGTVFHLSPGRNGKWKLTTLHRFSGSDGYFPMAPLYRDATGNLYGTTEGGGGRGCKGTLGCGTVFELSPSGDGWKFAVLHRFAGGTDGCSPLGALTMDREGALYGATPDCGDGMGVVYRLILSGGRWQESILYRFGRPPDAALPAAGVLFGSDDTMYGTAFEGGTFYQGAIFKLERSGGSWKESVPFSFDVSDGDDPVSLVPGGDGKYYGTTWVGGDGSCQGPGCGLVFEFVPR